MTIMIGMVYIFPTFYQEDKWTTGKELAQTFSIILLVALGNLLFSAWLGFFEFTFEVFIIFLGFTIAIGIFPVLIQILIRQNIYQRKNLKRSAKLNDQIKNARKSDHGGQELVLTNEEGATELQISAKHFLLAEAADNYVKVHYIRDNALTSHLFRNSLKNLEAQLPNDPVLYRCHRSYIVNLHNLRRVSGNARGYNLLIHDQLPEIPVSRRKIATFHRLVSSGINGPFPTPP